MGLGSTSTEPDLILRDEKNVIAAAAKRLPSPAKPTKEAVRTIDLALGLVLNSLRHGLADDPCSTQDEVGHQEIPSYPRA